MKLVKSSKLKVQSNGSDRQISSSIYIRNSKLKTRNYDRREL